MVLKQIEFFEMGCFCLYLLLVISIILKGDIALYGVEMILLSFLVCGYTLLRVKLRLIQEKIQEVKY